MEFKKLHPYFQFPFVKELYKGNITEIDENKKKTEQSLIITNIGYFLIRKRLFPSGYVCSNSISPEHISEVTLEDGSITFLIDGDSEQSTKNHNQKKTIASDEIVNILTIMMKVRSNLFGEISIDSNSSSLIEEIKNNLNSDFNSTPEIRNAEIFLANSINSSHSDITNYVPLIYEMFTNGKNIFNITRQILNSSIINPFVQVLSDLNNSYELIISNDHYSSFYNVLNKLIKSSKNLKKIVFDKISFSRINSQNIIFNEEKAQAEIESISFINGCDFSSNNFLIFLKDFSNYSGNIKSLIIGNCKFSKNTLPSFFDHINGIKSMKNVLYLEIDEQSTNDQLQESLIRLLNNQNQFFRCIKTSNSALDAGMILSRSTLFDNKIQGFHFQKCNFLNSIDQIDNFYSFDTLDFTGTKFTFESLKSLFNNIKRPIRNLILNSIVINQQDLFKFFDQLPQYNFDFLEEFEFAENCVSSPHVSVFLEFLLKMKNLSILNISSSFDQSDQLAISDLSSLLKNLPRLLYLTIKGSEKSSFNSEFVQIFDCLPPSLIYLDISGQNIGDDGMEKLADFLRTSNKKLTEVCSIKAVTKSQKFLTDFELESTGSLQYLSCSRTGCTLSGILKVVEAAASNESQIRDAEFDFDEVANDAPLDKTQIEEKIQQMKESINEKFAKSKNEPLFSFADVSPHSIIQFSISHQSDSNQVSNLAEISSKKTKNVETNKNESENESNKKVIEDENENESNKKFTESENGEKINENENCEKINESENDEKVVENENDEKVVENEVPPIIVKPTIDYRKIILSDQNQYLQDQLVECVGIELASKCPLEDTINNLEKEVPFLSVGKV